MTGEATDTSTGTTVPVPSGLVSWVVIAASTTLWLLHLVGMAVLAEGGCAGWGPGALHWLTVGLFVPTAGLTVLAWRRRRGTDGEVFLAHLAVWTGAINTFIIVAEWVPVLLLPACTA